MLGLCSTTKRKHDGILQEASARVMFVLVVSFFASDQPPKSRPNTELGSGCLCIMSCSWTEKTTCAEEDDEQTGRCFSFCLEDTDSISLLLLLRVELCRLLF